MSPGETDQKRGGDSHPTTPHPKTPIVTTSINFGDDDIYMPMIGMSSPWKITNREFRITVMGNVATVYSPETTYKPTIADASTYGWNINWIAVGFVC